MAKMFYSAKEAAERLGRSEDELKSLVRDGKLREFRDAGSVNYKVGDVDGLLTKASAKSAKPAPAAVGGSQSGEIVLEPVEDSSVELAPSGSDVVSIEGVDAEDTATGARVTKKAKEGSAVPSVGVNVFDDDELDEHVDPLAQTAVSDVAGLGLEGVGSGSGILDLTRESDDTSLGAELLEEIYTGEEGEAEGGAGGGEAAEMGEATRAGLDEALPAEGAEEAEGEAAVAVGVAAAAAAKPRAVITQVLEYAPDAVSTSLTAALVVGVAVMWVAGLGAAALVRGVTPSLLQSVYSHLAVFAGGSLLVCGIAAGATYFLAKRPR
ncbi:MAG: helix-turn-helix domain-containing protein [Planctomycetota bacterium]